MGAQRITAADGIVDITGDLPVDTDCLWGCRDCPVVARVNGELKVCPCDCRQCKRAWFAEGRPVLRNGVIVRDRNATQ